MTKLHSLTSYLKTGTQISTFQIRNAEAISTGFDFRIDEQVLKTEDHPEILISLKFFWLSHCAGELR